MPYKEYAITINLEVDTPLSVVEMMVDYLRSDLERRGYSKWISDIDWDEV